MHTGLLQENQQAFEACSGSGGPGPATEIIFREDGEEGRGHRMEEAVTQCPELQLNQPGIRQTNTGQTHGPRRPGPVPIQTTELTTKLLCAPSLLDQRFPTRGSRSGLGHIFIHPGPDCTVADLRLRSRVFVPCVYHCCHLCTTLYLGSRSSCFIVFQQHAAP